MSNKQTNQQSKPASKLVVLSAPSGAGKSTLAAMLLERHPDRFALSISYTTRKPRGTGQSAEKNGIHYFFVNEDQFLGMIERDEFLEHALVFAKYRYGTSRAYVESILASGKNALFDIDVQGASSLKKAFGPRCVTLFIHPPSMDELEARLRNRKTESPEAIALRLKTAREEVQRAGEFDYQITNSDLSKTYSEIESLLRKESCL